MSGYVDHLRGMFVAFSLVCVSVGALAAANFPRLSGRVVDEANILDAHRRTSLDTLLESHERATSNQVVVVTLSSLQGYDIADFGYQLGRHWGVGQQDKDNGVLLIVAPQERKVRIEVGYGLEGTLTDALASQIIQRKILPKFRNGDMPAGIESGAKTIVSALAGTYEPEPSKDESDVSRLFFILILFLFLWAFFGSRLRGRHGKRGRRRSRGTDIFIGTGGGGFRGGGFGGGGGGFGGGGGGFGGGGASGGW